MSVQEASQRPKPDDTLDISDAQCRALSEYVAHLPRPARVVPADRIAAEMAARGEERFANIGCAACQVPQVAEIDVIYSDLLLHDMGRGPSSLLRIVLAAPVEDVGNGFGQLAR